MLRCSLIRLLTSFGNALQELLVVAECRAADSERRAARKWYFEKLEIKVRLAVWPRMTRQHVLRQKEVGSTGSRG